MHLNSTRVINTVYHWLTRPLRKYRVLDDCTRLRDIIRMFPDHRHFAPSLLLLHWNSDVSKDIAEDVRDMVRRY